MIEVLWHLNLHSSQLTIKTPILGFPGGSVVKNLPANVGDMGWISDPERFHMPWGNQAHVPQLLKPVCPRASATREVTTMGSPGTADREQPPLTIARGNL